MKRLVAAGTLAILLLQPVLPDEVLAQEKTEIGDTRYFTDLKKTHWAEAAIMKLVKNGAMDAYDDFSFKPNQFTTRAEAAAVIVRTMGVSLDSDFELKAVDLPRTHPYYKEIRKLTELGIVQNNEFFNPQQPLKRAHISKMIALAYDIEVDEKNKASFKDIQKNYWAKSFIESLAEVGVVTGKTPKTFEPNSYVTRAQLAALAVRGMDFQHKVKDLEIAYDYLAKDYIETKNAYPGWTKEVIDLVNEIRIEKKLTPLLQDSHLTQLAIIKSQDMLDRNYFEHYSPHYGNPWDMATLFDYEYTSYGENIARNFKSPKDTVAGWMASTKHRDNILHPVFTHIGVGVKKDKKGNYYCIQQFSSK